MSRRKRNPDEKCDFCTYNAPTKIYERHEEGIGQHEARLCDYCAGAGHGIYVMPRVGINPVLPAIAFGVNTVLDRLNLLWTGGLKRV